MLRPGTAPGDDRSGRGAGAGPGELNTTSPAADCRRDINSGPTQSRLDPYRQGDRQRCQGEQSSPGEKRRGGANLLEQHASTHRADDGCQGGARLRTTICQPLLVARHQLGDQTRE